MKILFLAHRVPFPPNRGDRIRSYHLLRHLSRQNEVHLACLADELWTQDTEDRLKSLCTRFQIHHPSKALQWIRAALSFARGRSATEGLFFSSAFANTIRQWTDEVNYDVVFTYCSGMAAYLWTPALRHLPCIVDLVDVDSLKWAAYAADTRGPKGRLYAHESKRVHRLEQECAVRASALTLVSSAEVEDLLAQCRSSRVHSIANGVDLDYFSPRPEREMGDAPTCLFVGALDYRPNIDAVTWFCTNVWSQVLQHHPTAQFQIVGRRPASAVKDLGNCAGVQVIGDVIDVRPYFEGAHVVVAPLRLARGVQNKVLEAMAMGRPVIASTAAMTGLDVSDGVHLRRADNGTEWAEAVIHGFHDTQWRRRIAAAGREFVEQQHNWSSCLQPIDDLLLAMVAKDNSKVGDLAPSLHSAGLSTVSL
jgi:sugar transferase (PEP-CTERM/EpsH1 system associated)